MWIYDASEARVAAQLMFTTGVETQVSPTLRRAVLENICLERSSNLIKG